MDEMQIRNLAMDYAIKISGDVEPTNKVIAEANQIAEFIKNGTVPKENTND